MSYKVRFRPIEGLVDGLWQEIDPLSGDPVA